MNCIVEDLERYARKMINDSIGLVTSKSEFMESQQDDLRTRFKKVNALVDERLGEVLGKEEVKEYIDQKLDTTVQSLINERLIEQSDALKSLLQQSLNVPGVIGTDDKYQSLQNWVSGVEDRFQEIEKKNCEAIDTLTSKITAHENTTREFSKSVESVSEKYENLHNSTQNHDTEIK